MPSMNPTLRPVEPIHTFKQDEEILRGVHEGKLHPIMAFYEAWADQPEWDNILKDIYKNRRRKSKRKPVEF